MALSKKLLTVLDTDIHIHRLSIDVDVRDAICSEFLGTQPNAICSFSLVELKGNYIQKLVLLRRKTGESQSISDLIARIQNTGGRQCTLMISQLFYLLELHNTQSHNWRKTKNILLTLIDAQIDIAWEGFRINVTEILDDIDCTRATEEPEEKDGIWKVHIPRCTKENTNCSINDYILRHRTLLSEFVSYYDELPINSKTKELDVIYVAITATLQEKRFPWDRRICRKTGDLIIALQSIQCKELLSSNYKEQIHLSACFKYKFRKFPIASIRRK